MDRLRQPQISKDSFHVPTNGSRLLRSGLGLGGCCETVALPFCNDEFSFGLGYRSPSTGELTR